MVTRLGRAIRSVGGFVGIGSGGKTGVKGSRAATATADRSTTQSNSGTDVGVTTISTTSGTVKVPSYNGGGGTTIVNGGGGTTIVNGGGGSSQIPSGNIQQELRSSGITNSQSGQLAKPKPIVSQKSLRDKERYNPSTRQYETTRSNLYNQGTRELINVRQPTEIEKRRIDIMEKDTATVNIDQLKRDIKTVGIEKSKQKDLEKSIENIDKSIKETLKDKVNEKGEFIGTATQYRSYENLISKRNKLFNKYTISSEKLNLKDRSVSFSFYGKSDKVKISELDKKNTGLSISSEYWKRVPRQAGEYVGEGYGATVAKIKIGKKTGAVIDTNTGVYRLATEEDRGTIGKNILSPEKFGKGAGKVFGFAKYAIPYVGQAGFALEVGVDVKKSGGAKKFIKENPLQSALIVGGTLLGGGLAAKSIVKGKRIQRAVTKELSALERKQLKSLTIVDEGAGRVSAIGFRETPSGYQSIKIVGEIKKDMKGFKFIPKGEGTSKIISVAKPTEKTIKAEFIKNKLGQVEQLKVSTGKRFTGDNILFSSGQKFEIGSKGKLIQRGTKGEAKLYESVGSQVSSPISLSSGAVKIPENELGRLIQTKRLAMQLKKKREIPKGILELKFPIGKPDVAMLKNIGLKVSKEELGGIIIVPKKKIIKDIGSKGKGIKSSDEYFESLYKGTEQVQVQSKVLKEVLPEKESVAGKGIILAKSSVPKANIKPLTNIPSSVYAGTGLYERTQVQGIAPNIMAMNMQPSKVDFVPSTRTESKPLIKFEENIKVKQREVPKIKTQFENKIKLKELDKVKYREQPKFKDLQKAKTQLKHKQKFRPAQKTEQVEILRQVLRQRTEAPKVKTKLSMPIIKPKSGLAQRLVKKIETEDGFEAFGFKFGKEVSAAKGTKEEVAIGLKKFLKKGLSASGFVLDPTGKKVKASELLGVFGGEFRAGKKSSTLIVEKKEKRLRTGTTGKEIQFFKGSTKKRRSGLF